MLQEKREKWFMEDREKLGFENINGIGEAIYKYGGNKCKKHCV